MVANLRAIPALLVLWANVGWAIEPIGSSQSGVLLLRNGQVLQGEISNLGDRYQVTLAGGGEIRIPRNSVDLQCRNLHEAYALKSAAAQNGTLTETLDLSEWCLRHGMFGEAAEQLTFAMRRDSKHPRIAAIERRMQASVTKLPETSAAAPTTAANQHVTVEELERMQRELPVGSVEAFTSVVQPILINRCGANGCHGSAAQSSWRLLQPTGGQTLTRRFTQRNLHATLATLDRAEPLASKLLTVSREPHGTAKTAPLGSRDEASFKQIAKWVEQVTQTNPPPPQPSSLTERKTSLLQTTEPPRLAPATTNAPASEKEAPQKSPKEFEPRDAFDPEIFNRRFFGSGESR